MELHEYTDQEIRDEWQRRKAAQNHRNWYYFLEDWDEDPAWRAYCPTFIIINRSRYHIKHQVNETSISSLLKHFPHKRFREYSPGHFRYQSPTAKGEQILQKYGFCKLERPYLVPEACTIVNVNNIGHGGKEYRVTFYADTPEIMGALKGASFIAWNMDAFCASVKAFAEGIDCVAHWYDTNPHGTCIALYHQSGIPKEIG